MDPLQIDTSGDEVSVSRPATVSEDTSLVELLPVQGFLGLNDTSAKEKTQMRQVWEYFSEDAQGTGDALYKMKMTEMKMSPPRLGENRLSKLYNYVRLQQQQKIIEQEMATL